MKKTIIWLVLSSFVLLGTSLNADAKRLGGSKSMGRQSSTVTQKQQAAPAVPAQAPAAAPAATPATPAPAPAPQQPRKFGWGGMLGGLAAGLGMGWLLSHFGLGEAASSFFMGLLIVMAVAMIGLWLFRKFAGASYKASPAGNQQFDSYQYGKQEPTVSTGSSVPVQEAPASVSGIADFDQEAFLVNAKKHFVRLQEAWDQGDLAQLKEFATVEMFDELRQDLQARVAQNNKTEVLTLDAELLGVETTSDVYLASVRFSGMIREHADAPAESFVEVWNLVKPVQGQGGWVLAGIQQLV
ncbi:Tim44 domain-containing protein [Polynucleobacter sp. MWH-Spelu-300-X4]|uniref:Tim44 domain-containing protein n=1 Tax=Polynucleobacter sp. MWH-Spelu-300-X4 TaxID=2689109 RepID=UPI00203F4FFD|nr:Tim44-like domain-containing protein [Polynucleobacter sp. MWH-Spelu-300-X4]